jgi:protein involved in polysaccharide export with SLBB domain
MNIEELDFRMLRQLFFAIAVLLLCQSVQAQTPQLSDQQLQLLKQQYLGDGSKQNIDSKNTSSAEANDIAEQQRAVQPQPITPNVTSAIEASMRARLASDLKESVKDDLPSNLKNSDLVKPEKSEKREMADSRKEDLGLRSSWERFLENKKVRGVDSNISQFGYQLFAGAPNTFSPAADIPVPPEYVLGPGDELQLQFYGSRDDSLNLVVDREGVIELPKVGALTLVGLSFVQAKALIAEQVRQKMIGVTTSVTMGRLRSIRVFVLGDAEHPGSYLISGLSTISHALFSAGGVSKKGSLRHIQLKRNGKVVKELDLYDFLLKGNSRGDERLMPGDVIFIPPVGAVIGVAGQVNRPAIYELRAEKTAQEVADMAGGVLADADVKHFQIDRLSQTGDRNILDFDLKQSAKIQNGDILMLFAIPGMRADTVSLFGYVKRPGQYGLAKDMKLSNLINSVEDLLPGAFLDYALIQRTEPIQRVVTTLRVSLDTLLVKQDKRADIALQADDQVYVFSKSSIDPLNVVSIYGQIVNPGQYPYADKMRLVDLIFAAGGPNEEAYLKVAELTRYEVIEGKRQGRHVEVNLADALAGNADANMVLLPHDELLIRTISNWRSATRVTIKGEVKYPGLYPVEEGERLSSVLARAGGYTDEAYLRAAVFTRESVRADQQKQIDELAQRTEAEVAKLETSVDTLKDEMLRARQLGKLEAAKRVVAQIKAVRATGRIVIELADAEKLKDTPFDLAMRDGDWLYVPQRPDEVMVLGEVYNQTAFVYRNNISGAEYLAMAGGATRSGDVNRTYVVRANGMLDVVNKGWFGGQSISMEPGDAIVVPQEVEQFNFVDSTLDWSRVVMQVGVSLASMKTIGVFK